MSFIVFSVFALLIIFSVIQTILVLKYRRLNIYEKSAVASITHDLKNPALAQINMLNMLLNGDFGKLNPQQYEMIRLTCSSSKYMADLVGTILTNYKIETDRILLNKKQFDITKLINKLVDENIYSINDKGLKVVFPQQNEECYVFADELQIKRVLTNLLSNSVTYSLRNSFINISAEQNSKYVNISVTNKSHPISQKELRNIFCKFSKTKSSSLNKFSTGLGLYTAKRIIDSHHGIIYAKSSPDGLCTFGFRLKTANTKSVITSGRSV